MQFFVGTSGYSYKEWKGTFYPEKLSQKNMLSFYAERFAAVEINSSFRFLPNDNTVKSWMEHTPESFQFVLKAPEAITHRKRLKGAEDETARLLRTAEKLNGRRGPLLFQLPPNFKKDVARLDEFLGLLSKNDRPAFEFRHASWFDEDVFECLRKHSCALCVADAEDLPSTKLINTAGWGYLRLRGEQYTRKELQKWVERIKSQPWSEAYVFFKHEETGSGPKLAADILSLIAE
jgi:uncharacterized protein YecE (DUF72 family)